MLSIDLPLVLAEIEKEREWRQAELRLLKNRIAYIDDETEQNTARKALVVMLYAHFEGLCKSLLSIFVKELNNLGLLAKDAHSALVASSLTDVFESLRNPLGKSNLFPNPVPNDVAFRRYTRDREFVEKTQDFQDRTVKLNSDKIIDTESNLTPEVLQKILFRLGLPPELVDPWRPKIQHLIRRRNDIAHGSSKEGLAAPIYEELETAVGNVVDGLVSAILKAIRDKDYLA